MAIEIFNPPGLHTPQGYSHAARSGNTLYVAGQIALDPDGNLVGAGDVEAQARQVFTNLRTVLAAAGADFRHVIKTTVLLTRPEDIPGYRRVRGEFLSEPFPPSTLMVIQALARPDLLLEVEAVAVLEG